MLCALVEAGHEVVIVVTRPDARRSRRAAPSPSPVKEAARAAGLAVSHTVDDVLEVGAELGVVVAYGRIIRPPVLGSMPLVNVHFSLLPRWRGAAPVERAILAGDPTTGVSLMELEADLDTGPVYARAETPIGDDEPAAELIDRLARTGADLLVESLTSGLPQPVAQVGQPTYAAKLSAADLELHWERPAAELARLTRVGRAWTSWRGRRLLVLAARPAAGPGRPAPGTLDGDRVATGEGWLHLGRVQPEGRAAVDAGDWVRGARPTACDRLGG